MFKKHMNHKSCALSLAAAIVASAWYILGYLAFLGAQQVQFIDTALSYFPQLFIMLQFAPCPLMQPKFEILCFLLGLAQIFFMTLIFVWATVRLYEAFHDRDRRHHA